MGTVMQAPYQLAYRPALPKRNFRITAQATDAAGHTALSSPITCVATSKVQRQYKSYDYEETDEKGLRQVRLWIPEGLATVRGILVVSNPNGGDTRDWCREVWYGEFLHLHDFAAAIYAPGHCREA